MAHENFYQRSDYCLNTRNRDITSSREVCKTGRIGYAVLLENQAARNLNNAGEVELMARTKLVDRGHIVNVNGNGPQLAPIHIFGG
ncbi:hypothetical protein RRF57_008521 [Xylaria bambusicola]|uniref:Uncharacterized protein n=1 Tax=Xylaria bambusicola TaxID=326684 RepID=A0AAN7Z741_9PEZI